MSVETKALSPIFALVLFGLNDIYFCKMAEDSEHAGIPVVRELVHSFLLDLCCSRKHGISFHDVSLGTASR